MTELERTAWLKSLAELIERNPDFSVSYTNDDDGVWLDYGPDREHSINLRWGREDALNAIETAAAKSQDQ